MKVFLSYSTEKGTIAGAIKKQLDAFGFESFLAHEDIKATQTWLQMIYDKLKDCNIFLPILTAGFHNSYWTNQEIGISLALDKLIIPVKIDENPVGFISIFQALKCPDYKNFPLDSMISVIDNNDKYCEKLRDFFIGKLGMNSSFSDSIKWVKLLNKSKFLTRTQVQKIIQHSIKNDQIYKAGYAMREVKEIVNKYKHRYNKNLLKRFVNL